MLVFGLEREVQQGEEWTIDILLSQSDNEYIPFIVSSDRPSPMWAITVASTKYEKNERYVMTWWLPVGNLPKFKQTTVFDLGEQPTGYPVKLPEGHAPMDCLYRYTQSGDEIDNKLGHKPYHYIYFTEISEQGKTDYECRIIQSFTSEETAQWGSQNYMYQITLVDTVPMTNMIKDAHTAYPDLPWRYWPDPETVEDWDEPEQELDESEGDFIDRWWTSWQDYLDSWIMNNQAELYTFIKDRVPNWFQSDIDIDAPVGWIGAPQVILPPTKLQVNNNLRRII